METLQNAFRGMASASTKSEYQLANHQMKEQAEKAGSDAAVVSKYVAFWLRYKECWVTLWTQNYAHFGHSTTSSVGDSHACLKRTIATSSDFGVCFEAIDWYLRLSDSAKHVNRGKAERSFDVFLLKDDEFPNSLGWFHDIR